MLSSLMNITWSSLHKGKLFSPQKRLYTDQRLQPNATLNANETTPHFWLSRDFNDKIAILHIKQKGLLHGIGLDRSAHNGYSLMTNKWMKVSDGWKSQVVIINQIGVLDWGQGVCRLTLGWGYSSWFLPCMSRCCRFGNMLWCWGLQSILPSESTCRVGTNCVNSIRKLPSQPGVNLLKCYVKRQKLLWGNSYSTTSWVNLTPGMNVYFKPFYVAEYCLRVAFILKLWPYVRHSSLIFFLVEAKCYYFQGDAAVVKFVLLCVYCNPDCSFYHKSILSKKYYMILILVYTCRKRFFIVI